MNKMEVRFLPVNFSETSGDSLKIQGYVNITEEYSEALLTNRGHKFVEKIAKGAFGRAIQRAEEIDFLAEHDERMILASTRNNSLKLVEDDKGLFMSAIISPTTWGKDYYTLVRDGIIQNFSFGFVAVNDDWEERADGLLERTINELELYEVSLVKNPAYSQSYAEARSIMTLDETLKRGEDMSKEKEKVDLEEVDETEDISKIISQEMEKHFNRILEEIKDRQKEDNEEDEEKNDNTQDEEEVENSDEKDVEKEDVNEERDMNSGDEDAKESDDEKTLKSTILGLEMKVEKVQSMLEEFLNDKAREEKEDEQTDETEEEKQKEKEQEKEGDNDSPSNLEKLQETLANLKEYD